MSQQLMTYFKMESLQVRGGDNMRTGVLLMSEKKEMSPVPPQTGDLCGERWRYPTRATLGRTLAGPEAYLMCPVRDASL